MDSIIEKVLYRIIQKISSAIFKGAEDILTGTEGIISNHQLFAFSQIFFLFFIIFFSVFAIKRALYFKNGQKYQIKGYWNENKKYIIQMSFVFIICLFPTQILHFTFDYWSSFMNERNVFQQIKETTEKIDNGTMTTNIHILMSSLSALFISLIQAGEVLALILILLLSPFILIISLFKRNIFVKFTQILGKSLCSPIIQTFLMYLFFQTFLPAFLEEGNFTPLMQSLIIFSMIVFSFKGAKYINYMLFTISFPEGSNK